VEQERAEISWGLVAKAMNFYTNRLYKSLEVPWIVSREACAETYDGDMSRFSTPEGILVGSAEQSFIQLLKDGKDFSGQPFVAASPCFRDEQTRDGLHFNSFFKVELFYLNYDYRKLLADAEDFFRDQIGLITKRVEIGENQTDLFAKGIEIGSYGERRIGKFRFAYGTGLAEPRTSQVLYDF
jgi:hypothetical protein